MNQAQVSVEADVQECDFDTQRSDYQKRSQCIVFKAFLPLYLKLRFLKISPYLSMIVMFAISFFTYLINKPGYQFTGSYSNPFVINDDILNKLQIELSYGSSYSFNPTICIFPNNWVAQKIIKAREGNFYNYEPVVVYNNKDDFDRMRIKNITNKIFYDVTNLLTLKQSVELYYQSNDKNSDSNEEPFIDLLFEFENISITRGESSLPTRKIYGYAIFTSLFMCISSSFLYLLSFTEIISLQESRVFLLLVISGAREYILWIVFILPELEPGSIHLFTRPRKS